MSEISQLSKRPPIALFFFSTILCFFMSFLLKSWSFFRSGFSVRQQVIPRIFCFSFGPYFSWPSVDTTCSPFFPLSRSSFNSSSLHDTQARRLGRFSTPLLYLPPFFFYLSLTLPLPYYSPLVFGSLFFHLDPPSSSLDLSIVFRGSPRFGENVDALPAFAFFPPSFPSFSCRFYSKLKGPSSHLQLIPGWECETAALPPHYLPRPTLSLRSTPFTKTTLPPNARGFFSPLTSRLSFLLSS